MKEDIMKYESVLPENFDGVFRFSNYSDEDFVGVWGSKEYHFPANSTSPMIIPEHSPLEIQNIRKKFAKDLAEREFFKSGRYEELRQPEGTPGHRNLGSLHAAHTYSLDQLAPYIQRALEDLPGARATVRPASRVKLEDKLNRDENSGDIVTKAVDRKIGSLDEKTFAKQ